MIGKNIFAAVAACVAALSSPFADGEELYAFEFLHLGKAVGRYNDDPGPRLDPGSRPGHYPARLGRTAHLASSAPGLDPARCCRTFCDPPSLGVVLRPPR